MDMQFKERTNMSEDNRIVLCGANAYEKKYYFNEQFNRLPQSIKDELHVICVLFTEEIGGIFTIAFGAEGDVELATEADEEDVLYDEIGSGLLVGEVRRNRQELFESLKMYYRVFVLKESADELLGEEG
jgi:hypothetical protein